MQQVNTLAHAAAVGLLGGSMGYISQGGSIAVAVAALGAALVITGASLALALRAGGNA